MVFYFSGTGNSRWVAEYIAKELNDSLVFIPDAIKQEKYFYSLKQEEKLGFVFPCYAWSVPTFISQFISMLNINNVSYLYYICTCGDDTGRLQQEFCRIVEAKGWTCYLGYDIMMPESYVCLPGFDVDTNEKEQNKIYAAKSKLNFAVDDIIDCRKGTFVTLPGGCTWLKSVLLRWAFHKWLMTPRYFKTNEKCIGCGMCVKSCPFENIQLNEQRPEWGNQCVDCLRCYHSCPSHAIEWGRWTSKKGQYLMPKDFHGF